MNLYTNFSCNPERDSICIGFLHEFGDARENSIFVLARTRSSENGKTLYETENLTEIRMNMDQVMNLLGNFVWNWSLENLSENLHKEKSTSERMNFPRDTNHSRNHSFSWIHHRFGSKFKINVKIHAQRFPPIYFSPLLRPLVDTKKKNFRQGKLSGKTFLHFAPKNIHFWWKMDFRGAQKLSFIVQKLKLKEKVIVFHVSGCVFHDSREKNANFSYEIFKFSFSLQLCTAAAKATEWTWYKMHKHECTQHRHLNFQVELINPQEVAV